MFSFVADLLLPPLVILILIKEGIVVFAVRETDHDTVKTSIHHSPFRYVLGSVALVGQLIEHQTELAALLPRGDAVEADVEVGAVVGVSVLGVGVELAELISRGAGGTLQSICGLQS